MNEWESREREPQFSEGERQELIQYALEFGTPERVSQSELSDTLDTYAYVLPLEVDQSTGLASEDELLDSGALEFIDVADERAGMGAATPFVRISFRGEIHLSASEEVIEKSIVFFMHENRMVVNEYYSHHNRRVQADGSELTDLAAEYHSPTPADYKRLMQVVAQLRRRYQRS